MTAGRVLVLFVFYVAAIDLALGWGFIRAVASPVGLALLVAAGLLFAWSAFRAVRPARTAAPGSLSDPLALSVGPRSGPKSKGGVFALLASRVLLRAGAALTLIALPASLVLRDTQSFSVGEGEELAAFGEPPLRFGEVTLAPRGPHLLSKTVEIEAVPDSDEPMRIGLFPPASIAGRRWSVFRFGYAPGFSLAGARGESIAQGYLKLGTFPQTEETASLVQWTPETNLMMGAGTFPPRLEDLVSPPGSDLHVFLRFVEASLGGVRRDLTDPDSYKWLLDGRPEQAVLLAQVFRGRERVFDGRVRAGETVRFPGGSLELSPDVLLWVDLLVTRDPWLPLAVAGLALIAAGAVLRAANAVVGTARRQANLHSP